MSIFIPGDIVCPVDQVSDPLVSGCSVYSAAIVIRKEPLVLVSKAGDMRWEHSIRNTQFKKIGDASADELNHVMHRVTG